jgi:hypothetical protein
MNQPPARPDRGARFASLHRRAAAGSPPRPWHQRTAVRLLEAAAVFVLGMFLGGVIVGVTVSGPTPPAPRVTVTRAAPAPPALGGPAGATARAVVSQACLQAINLSQSSYAGIQGLVDALRALDAARINRQIRRLQPIQMQLRQQLRTCKVTVNGLASSSRAASPTPSGAAPSH